MPRHISARPSRLRARRSVAAMLALALAAGTLAEAVHGREGEQGQQRLTEPQETLDTPTTPDAMETPAGTGQAPAQDPTPAASQTTGSQTTGSQTSGSQDGGGQDGGSPATGSQVTGSNPGTDPNAASPGPTVGQNPPRPAPASDSAARSQAQKQRMEQLETDMKGSAAEQARLAGDIETLKGDRAKLNAALIDTATKVRDVEDKLDASEQRLVALEREEADIRESLDSRRDEMAEVLGGLARLGNHPPPALLVRPDDALQSVRSAMLLGAVLPELKAETELLASELAAQERVRKDVAAERDALAELKATLGEQRRRTAALIEERQRLLEQGETALAAERERAAAFAAEASNVRDLLKRMETEIAAARKAADAAKAMTNKTNQSPSERLAALRNPGRMTPGVAFAEARGLLPLPVSGGILKNFGAEDGYGGAEKGMSFGTRRQAQVAAPSDGWVVYAGPFRSYGQLLIINAGGGYHILMAGMDKITVELGQFVLSGEPVGVMGDGPQLVSSVGLGTAQPILYVEFRKDGISIDPTPWWVTSESEKARG